MDVFLFTTIELSKITVLISVLFGIAWLVIAKPLQLYHNSSIRFALANLFFALYLIIRYLNTDNHLLYLWAIADIILLIAMIIYNLALRYLFRLTADPSIYRWLIILVVITFTLYTVKIIPLFILSVCSLVSLVYVVGGTMHMKYTALRQTFSISIAGILSLSDMMIFVLLTNKLWLGFTPDSINLNHIIPSPYQPAILLWLEIFLLLFINITAVGTTISRLIVRMKYLADHDQLTGLLNRRSFQSQLNYQYALFERYQRSFSLMMLDIDHFKSINDTYGHSAGDCAIIHTAKVLREQVRSSDLVARFGGEEFIILLPDQTLQDAKVIADKICLTLSQSVWKADCSPITISIGCAAVEQANSTDDLLKLADDALYIAKANGRNQAIISQDPNAV